MKALITGVSGFAGSHLAEYLLGNTDWEIHGLYHLDHVTHHIAHLQNVIHLHEGDITDERKVKPAISEIKPEFIFHLAAQAAVALSVTDPAKTLQNNILGQLNVLEAAIALEQKPRVLVIGSADEYGLVYPHELPVKETNPLRPLSPYAVSKIAQDHLGYQYFLSNRLPVIRLRPFNHIGPRQSDAFVTANFAKQIAEAEAGLRAPVVKVGNLTPRRDFSDVRDMVRGYFLAITQGEPGEVYNLGAERTYSIREVLDNLLAMSPLQFAVEVDPARLRDSDVAVLLSDCSKFRALTGWRAEMPLRDSLAAVLDYWRDRVRSDIGGNSSG